MKILPSIRSMIPIPVSKYVLRSGLYKLGIVFGILGFFLGLISYHTSVDLDIFHEMALFRAIITGNSFPRHDLFAYVPTIDPAVHHEWGFGALAYFSAVSSGLGTGGLLLFKYLLCAGIGYGSYAYTKRYGSGLYEFGFVSLVAIFMGSAGFVTVRAQLFSLFLLVLLLHLLKSDREGKKVWVLVWLPVYILWVNVHAGFLLGTALFILYIFERFITSMRERHSFPAAILSVKHLLLVLVLMGLCVMINPWGLDYLPYLWRAVTFDRSPYITEWSPLWKHGMVFVPMFCISLALLGYCALKTKSRDFSLLSFVCITAWLTLWHVRYLPIYSLAWLCYVSPHLAGTNIGTALVSLGEKRNLFYLGIWLLIGIGGTKLAIDNQIWHLRVPPAKYPVGAAQFLKDHNFYGNLMVPFSAGSYISWKLYPQVKVSMDSRFEVAYPLDIFLDHDKFYSGREDWKEIPYKYPTDAILVPVSSPVGKLANGTIGNENKGLFYKIYMDDEYFIFSRFGPGEQMPLLDKRGIRFTESFP